MAQKKVTIANFNTVFLKDDGTEAPMLEYFDTIVMPALLENSEKKRKGTYCFFRDVKVIGNRTGREYVLTGRIVKFTVLEIKSDLDTEGNLIEKDDKYSTAPYSTFVIFLKNHRMLIVENQKGSPRIDSFRSTIKSVIDDYVNKKNKILKENNEELLPIPLVNVVGIPSRESIEEALRNVKKINKLTLNFYPLNGDDDVNFDGALQALSGQVRKAIRSRTGHIVFNSPEDKLGIVHMLSQTQGIVDPTINVEYNDGRKDTFKNDMITERATGNFTERDYNIGLRQAIEYGKSNEKLSYVSESNNNIYEQYKPNIIPFVKRNSIGDYDG